MSYPNLLFEKKYFCYKCDRELSDYEQFELGDICKKCLREHPEDGIAGG